MAILGAPFGLGGQHVGPQGLVESVGEEVLDVEMPEGIVSCRGGADARQQVVAQDLKIGGRRFLRRRVRRFAVRDVGHGGGNILAGANGPIGGGGGRSQRASLPNRASRVPSFHSVTSAT